MHWKNTMAGYCATPSTFCSRLQSYIDTNAAYVNQMVTEHRTTSPYWNQVGGSIMPLLSPSQTKAEMGMRLVPT